jgi:hypothetical protein
MRLKIPLLLVLACVSVVVFGSWWAPVLGSASAARWRIVNSPGQGSLLSVSCASTPFCVAVGETPAMAGAYAPPEPVYPLIERWDGKAWSIQPAPPLQGTACDPSPDGASATGSSCSLSDVSCVSSQFCMAIGQLEGASLSVGYRWNGSTWTLFSIPGVLLTSGSADGSDSLSCTSSQFCVAVGTAQGPLSLYAVRAQWNGAKWLLHRGAADSYLSSVSCTSAHWCLATGGDMSGFDYEIWNGRTWSDQKGAPQEALLSCAVTRVCTAIDPGSLPGGTEERDWLARQYARGVLVDDQAIAGRPIDDPLRPVLRRVTRVHPRRRCDGRGAVGGALGRSWLDYPERADTCGAEPNLPKLLA